MMTIEAFALLVGLCLSTAEDATHTPAWGLAATGNAGAALVAACERDPYRTLVQMKGVGNLLTPTR